MANKKKEVYKVKPLNENKKNIIAALIDEYDIESAEDIQEALKDLLGGTIKSMMEVEMDDHLGYESYERSDSDNYRNGTKKKNVRGTYGEMEIDVPADRKSTFDPQVVKKRQKDISDIDSKIISMYARGLTTRQISDQIEEIYGFECSEGFISDVTDKSLQDITDWQNRPLDEIYPIMFIDAVHFSVREDHIIKKLAAYVILGITLEGRKDVISLQIGENESSKYWLGVLNDLKNRGVKDVMIICDDGLTGIKEAIQAAFPKAEYQRCIVHQVRNTLKHVPYKDMKAFAADLKTIYEINANTLTQVVNFDENTAFPVIADPTAHPNKNKTYYLKKNGVKTVRNQYTGCTAAIVSKSIVGLATGAWNVGIGTGWGIITIMDAAYSNYKFKTWDKIYTSFPSSKKYVKITAVWKWHGGHKTYYPTGKMTAKYVKSK